MPPKQTEIIGDVEIAVLVTYADGEVDRGIIRNGALDLGPDSLGGSLAFLSRWKELWKSNEGRPDR
jgi:hypothetical protein